MTNGIGRGTASAADGRSGAPVEREARSGFGFAHGFAHILRVTCLTRAPPRARSAGRLYCTVFLVCFCSQGENTVFFVFLNPIFVVLPPRIINTRSRTAARDGARRTRDA